ncbi:MAG: ParB/RepB/Spo0J family partition protein [Bacteroidota bacterium]
MKPTSMNNNIKRNALGRGLSALLEDANTDITASNVIPVNSINEILISQIQGNPFQPRTEFDEIALKELSESIIIHGVIQPITVRKMGYDTYQIISGERRTRASLLAGFTKIPAFVRVANDQEMLEMALIENIQREELNAMEIAFSYKRLLEECSLTQEQLADRVAKNKTTVINYLRLLKLPENIQLALKENKISMGHARAIINVADEAKQQLLFEQMIAYELSVREVETLVRNSNDSVKNEKPIKKSKLQEYLEYQQSLTKKFSSKVAIKADEKGRGTIKILFKSQAELQRILDILG